MTAVGSVILAFDCIGFGYIVVCISDRIVFGAHGVNQIRGGHVLMKLQ